MLINLADGKVYHISAVRSFYGVVGVYYAKQNNIAHALYCYLILKSIEPDHPLTQRLGDEIVVQEILKLSKKMGEKKRR